MLIKFTDETPNFEESIRILKRRYNTTASSRAVRKCVIEFSRSGMDHDNLIEIIKLKDQEIKNLRLIVERLLGYQK
jgi:hypothetical protein